MLLNIHKLIKMQDENELSEADANILIMLLEQRLGDLKESYPQLFED